MQQPVSPAGFLPSTPARRQTRTHANQHAITANTVVKQRRAHMQANPVARNIGE